MLTVINDFVVREIELLEGVIGLEQHAQVFGALRPEAIPRHVQLRQRRVVLQTLRQRLPIAWFVSKEHELRSVRLDSRRLDVIRRDVQPPQRFVHFQHATAARKQLELGERRACQVVREGICAFDPDKIVAQPQVSERYVLLQAVGERFAASRTCAQARLNIRVAMQRTAPIKLS